MILNEAEVVLAASKKDINITNVNNGQVKTAFSHVCGLDSLCQGDGNTVYVIKRGCESVVELNCSSIPFTVIRGFGLLSNCSHMLCYIPAPYRSIVISSVFSVDCISIDQVSGDRYQILWSIEGRMSVDREVNGREIPFTQLSFSPQLGLLGLDRKRKTLMVLDPLSGKYLQTINLSDKGEIYDMVLYEDNIVMHHNNKGAKVSFFSIS